MVIPSYKFSSLPQIYFGANSLEKNLPALPLSGKKILVVASKSFQNMPASEKLSQYLQKNSKQSSWQTISGEPTVEAIDTLTAEYRDKGLDLILAVGGGSVIDSGKAISAMLTTAKGESVQNYLEDVGNKSHDGKKIPMIAVPTTAGTGSETTKNAVISRQGPSGIKRSLRHENFIPNYAIVDPTLHLTCPAPITAACGLDAFTQLLESFVSTGANPMTDALALSGLEVAKTSLGTSFQQGSDLKARSDMAYAALLSGITLANAGLGIIHGLAAELGGISSIPHGIVCGTLLASATEINIQRLAKAVGVFEHESLKKYAHIGALLTGSDAHHLEQSCQQLLQWLNQRIEEMKLPRLSDYGILRKDLDIVAGKVSNKNNPIRLSASDITSILVTRL
jgi:alcohol dehydrogenase class IV